jgi:phosphatidylglycerophosphatase A
MNRTLFSRKEMTRLNVEKLKERGISVESIAEISYKQQSRWLDNIKMSVCLESVYKVLSLRDTFHMVQLGAEIDRLCEEKQFKGPIQDILMEDLGVFGIDEIFGINLSGIYGAIGQTNFGDIDVNKPGIVDELNDLGKKDGICHTFMDDIVGAIAAAASIRVAQIVNENMAHLDYDTKDVLTIFDLEDLEEE